MLRSVLAALVLATCLVAEEVPLQGGGSAAVARLEAHGIAVAMIPELGGKLISLRGPDGHEWLSRSGRAYRSRAGLAGFGDGEFDGADEIFPTMDACDDLPAHGEAWRLAWTRCDGPGLSYALDGRLRPYRLVRSITIVPDGVVLDYTLENRGPGVLRYYYLFHPLLAIGEPLRMELPAGQTVRITGSQHDFLGARRELPWSELEAGAFAAATADPAAKRYWSLNLAQAPSVVRLRRPGGSTLTMTWDRDVLPRMAVWGCEGSPFVGNLAHLGPEPCTGLTKKLSDAIADGSAASLEPGAVRHWRISLAFAPR